MPARTMGGIAEESRSSSDARTGDIRPIPAAAANETTEVTKTADARSARRSAGDWWKYRTETAKSMPRRSREKRRAISATSNS